MNYNAWRCLAFLPLIFFGQTLATQAETNHFLVINDAHLHQSSLYTMDLAPSKFNILNDLDEATFDRLMDLIAQKIKTGLIPKPKFVLYLGDIVGHLRIGEQFIWNGELAFFTKFTTVFSDVPILYTFGNNDSYTANYGPFTSTDKNGVQRSPLDAAYATGKWKKGFISTGKQCQQASSDTPCVISENQEQGYYAAYLEPGLRLITLNTILLSVWQFMPDFYAIEQQFTWLEQQLQQAKEKHETVLITMHIPPGVSVYDDLPFFHADNSTRLITLLAHYHDIIIGILAGHTHMDEMRLVQTPEGKNLLSIYLSPAISTAHQNAPAIRSYDYEKQASHWQLKDYTTFYVTQDSEHHLKLQKLYQFQEVYCDSPVSNMQQCWDQITLKKMQKYYTSGNQKTHLTIKYPNNLLIRVTK